VCVCVLCQEPLARADAQPVVNDGGSALSNQDLAQLFESTMSMIRTEMMSGNHTFYNADRFLFVWIPELARDHISLHLVSF